MRGNSCPLWSVCCEFRLPFPWFYPTGSICGQQASGWGGWWGALWDTGLLILLLFVAPPYQRERAPVISDRTAAHGVSAFLQPPATHSAERIKGPGRGGNGTDGVPPAPSSPPSLPWDAGATVEGAAAIRNRFCTGGLRFKAVTFFQWHSCLSSRIPHGSAML